MNNKRSGITMVELLIYITLFSFVMILVGKQVVSLINQYTTGKSTSHQQLDARNVITALFGEIENTGAKLYLKPSGYDGLGTAPGVTVSSVYATRDWSSFVHKQGDPGDTLTIMKAEMDKTGNFIGIVDTIRYYLDNTSLIREFKCTGKTMTKGTLIENVYALQFSYGTNIDTTSLFNQDFMNFTPALWTLTNTAGTAPDRYDDVHNTTLTFSDTAQGTIKYGTALSVMANQKYLVLLKIEPSGNFGKKIDSLNFSFRRTSDNTIIGSEKFMPLKDGNLINITIRSTENVYASIDYRVQGLGVLTIYDVHTIPYIESGTYTWMNNPILPKDKQKVRVIRVQMLTRSDNKTEVKTAGPVTVGDVTISTSDNYTWRYLDEIIETPDNSSGDFSSFAFPSSNFMPGGLILTDAKIRSSLISVTF